MLNTYGNDLDYGYSESPEDYYGEKTYVYNGSEACPIYTNHHAIPRNNEKTIRPDLESLGLPSDIVIESDKVYQDMDYMGTKRGRRRKMLLFYCAFTAYNQLGISIDPFTLAKTCGLEKSGVSKALSMCSPVHTNSNAMLVLHTPDSFIRKYYNILNEEWVAFPDGALEDIMNINREVMEKDPSLSDEKPQTVAAAILVFYLHMHGYSIDKSKYKVIFERSDMTINKIKKKIIEAYNE